jgi:hypothetical protein
MNTTMQEVITEGRDTTSHTARVMGIAQVVHMAVFKAIRKAANITACQSVF